MANRTRCTIGLSGLEPRLNFSVKAPVGNRWVSGIPNNWKGDRADMIGTSPQLPFWGFAAAQHNMLHLLCPMMNARF